MDDREELIYEIQTNFVGARWSCTFTDYESVQTLINDLLDMDMGFTLKIERKPYAIKPLPLSA